MRNIEHLQEAEKKVIASLQKHVVSGYKRNLQVVNHIETAIREGKIQLRRSADDYASFDDLAGEVFNPGVNPSIEPERLKLEAKKFRTRIRNAGVWVFQSFYWTGREWISSDAIGGFVGWDFIGSGYELQVLESALNDYNKQALDVEGFVIDPFRAVA